MMVAMMANAFLSIKQGLAEAIEFSKGGPGKAVVLEFGSLDAKKVRAKVGISQNEFTSAFGISMSTPRHWERGDPTPQVPALLLLNVVAKEAEIVLRALAS
jgi:putative transcriptional regulator